MWEPSKEKYELRVPVIGGSIFIRKWIPDGDNQKIPLVLLHDSLGCVALWKDFPRDLSETLSRRVMAYDRLGYGKSDLKHSPPTPLFIEEEAKQFLSEVKKQLGVTDYMLLGHSVGGGMALHIASIDKNCKAVITISAQAFVEHKTIEGIKAAKRWFSQANHFQRLEKWHGEKARWVLNAWTNVWLSDEFSRWSLDTIIGKVQCPVLVIHGDNDEYGSEAFPQYIADRSGGFAQLSIISECGHFPHREKPRDVLLLIKGFLDQKF